MRGAFVNNFVSYVRQLVMKSELDFLFALVLCEMMRWSKFSVYSCISQPSFFLMLLGIDLHNFISDYTSVVRCIIFQSGLNGGV